jgi:hypothetical protein
MSFTVIDHERDHAVSFDSRPDADDAFETAKDLADNPEQVEQIQGAYDDYAAAVADDAETDGGEPEVIDHDTDSHHEPEVMSPDEIDRAAADLPERNVGDDPLKWLPGEFVDTIDGSPAINRKGFEVLGHFYDVAVSADLQVAPEDTDHEYARVKATAEIDGRTVEAFGSAHVDRGDDSYLILEMADTRARKRALSIATGAGAVAVSELKNEPEGR